MTDTSNMPAIGIADIDAIKYSTPPRPRGHDVDTPCALAASVKVGARWYRVRTVGLGTIYIVRAGRFTRVDVCRVLKVLLAAGPDSAAVRFR